MLADARRGDLIGVAFAAIYRQRRYVVDTTGEAHRDPLITRGMVMDLSDLLGELARGAD